MPPRAIAVTGIGLLLALAATVGPLPSPTGEPGASLAVRLPDAVRSLVLALLGLSVLLLLAVQRPRRPAEDSPELARVSRRPAWAAVLMPLPFIILAAGAWYVSQYPPDESGHPFERALNTIAGLFDLLTQARKAPASVPAFDYTLAALALLFAVGLFALMLIVVLPARWWWTRPVAAIASPAGPAADEGLDDPRAEPDPRVAVLLAYGRFERALAAAHAPRAPWQTPAELMRATLAHLPVPAPALRSLTALVELARFSDRPLGPDARATACDALDEITRALQTREHA